MRDLEYFVVIFILIILGMYGLYSAGTTFEYGLVCQDCKATTPLSQYSDIQDKALYFLTFIPLFIFNKLNLNLNPVPEINFAFGMTISFFIFFATIALIYWILRRLLMLIFKDDPTGRDTQ